MSRRERTSVAAARVRLLCLSILLALLTAVVLPVLAPAALPITSRAWADDHLVIETDAGAAAMVSGANLAAGLMPPRCISINYTGAVADDALSLFAVTSGSELASLISVTIDIGTGGTYGDCSLFTGSTVYEGTLADLGQDHGTELTALPLTKLADNHGQVSFRFGFAIASDNRAQGQSTGADFTWIAGAGIPSAGGGTIVTPLSVGSVVHVPLAGPTPPTVKPSKKPAAHATSKAHRVVSGTTRHQAKSHQGTKGFAAALKAVTVFIRKVSKPLAKGVGIGMGMSPLVGLFLLVQGSIDGREPKLKDAPVHAEPDLAFGVSPQAEFG
jgi:hypothetical protein